MEPRTRAVKSKLVSCLPNSGRHETQLGFQPPTPPPSPPSLRPSSALSPAPPPPPCPFSLAPFISISSQPKRSADMSELAMSMQHNIFFSDCEVCSICFIRARRARVPSRSIFFDFASVWPRNGPRRAGSGLEKSSQGWLHESFALHSVRSA